MSHSKEVLTESNKVNVQNRLKRISKGEDELMKILNGPKQTSLKSKYDAMTFDKRSNNHHSRLQDSVDFNNNMTIDLLKKVVKKRKQVSTTARTSPVRTKMRA